jgi:sulfate transport system substrate-binding protein
MERTSSRLRGLLPAILLAALFLYAAWPWLPFARVERTPPTIVFYGFSILGEAIEEGVFPAFQTRWRERTGETVELVGSFAGSGTITNQILLGAPAEIALVALEPDAERIAAGGAADPESWKKLPDGGVVNRTPFVILVRPGNPKGIHDFADLARPGIRVVHPDPRTSGGALWSILAEWGAGERQRPGGGRDLLLGVWRNVVAQAASARAARTQLENGFGDALVTYEQEALRRPPGSARFEIVYPRATVLAEHTLVVVSRNVPPERRALVDAFAAFLWSDEAQRLFVRYGFRSVDERLDAARSDFGAIAEPFRVADLGGWRRAKADVIDRVWRDDVMKQVGR